MYDYAMKTKKLTETIRLSTTGTLFGSFQYDQPDFPTQLQNLQIETKTNDIKPVLIYSKFTDKVFFLDQNGQSQLEYDPAMQIHATHVGHDGLILPADVQGYGLFQVNADCPAIILYKEDGTLANLHGGLNCIEREDGGSIVKSALEVIGSDGVHAFVCAGARECCFGHFSNDSQTQRLNDERAKRIVDRFGMDVIAEVKNPPRKGGIGYNMFKIIRQLLNENGVTDDRIEMDDCCTSCAGLSEAEMLIPGQEGTYFSNLRQTDPAMKGGRNAVYAWRLMSNDKLYG